MENCVMDTQRTPFTWNSVNDQCEKPSSLLALLFLLLFPTVQSILLTGVMPVMDFSSEL